MGGRNILCAGIIVMIGMSVLAADAHAFFGSKKKAKESKESAPASVEEKAAASAETVAPAAETKKAVPAEKKAEAAAPVAQQPDSPAMEKMRQQRKVWKERLNNTTWTMEIMPLAGGKKETDALMFEENKVYSKNNKKNGFNATNYTLTVKDDTTIVWETMQTAESGEILFWRGEVSEQMDAMRGVVSFQLPGGTSTDYSFVAKDKKPIQ